jgi:hypothetical protein
MSLVNHAQPSQASSSASIRVLWLAVCCVLAGVLSGPGSVAAGELPEVVSVERQPLVAATKRLVEALKYAGTPLLESDLLALNKAYADPKADSAIQRIQSVLDRYCLVGVHINAESRVKVAEGVAKRQLIQQGWRTFLVKVHNEAGVTASLQTDSPQALPVYMRGRGTRQRPSTKAKLVQQSDVGQRFLDIALFKRQPLRPTLSGLELEYRILQLYSRDVGRREAKLSFHVGQGTQDLGFRSEVAILFECIPAVEVSLGIRDIDGSPTMMALVIRDFQGRIYPNPARRMAPDFFFHNQVYRADGESVHLPPGEYRVEVSRGPEYVSQTYRLVVPSGVASFKADFRLERWIHPATRRWFSGDHHVHAAGCAHYDSPTEGVTPADMMRHILGEDLNVGCVLSWGPCWYSQKQYFEGRTSSLSRPLNLMRYDVEVSGFPSSHAGHLCLLRLTEDDYPGAKLIEEWPSWTLPVLEWGKRQGGVVGYSHSGWGLALPDYTPDGKREFVNYRRVPMGWTGRAADTLPDYAMPPFDGIGANEFIVTVVHDVCHFISAVDTPSVWELNIWYHTLNCGFRSRISGETDFPCIYGDKVGLGRVYVKLDKNQPLTFDNWIAGVRDGRSYCGDGRSHILDFRVDDVAVGEGGSGGAISQLNLKKPGKVKVRFDVAARLEPVPTALTKSIRGRRLDQKPYWHIERSRLGSGRTVPVEVIVNGYPVARKVIEADGTTRSLKFDIELEHSSWVAVRIFPSVHTNPVFVEIDEKPIRASRRSARWCRKAVDVCWDQKKGRIRESDRGAAEVAYDKARSVYDLILEHSVAD